MTTDQIGPREEAALLVAMLESRGAVFTIDDATGHFRCDLDGVDCDDAAAERYAAAVLGLRDEIRAELHARRVLH